MIAVTVNFSIQAALVWQTRGHFVLAYWPGLVLLSIQGGFAGCLSTVSTYAVEVGTLISRIPKSFAAYAYILISCVGATLLGVGIFAWSVWAD